MDNKIFLFPLQNSVLFRKVTLPFHIFEARYRQMVKDALHAQIPIGIVPLYGSGDYRGEICVAGLPHILTSYPDGRMDIYITGTVKCRLTEIESREPYMVYHYRPMLENTTVDESSSLEVESLKVLLQRWSVHFLPDPTQREQFAATLEDPEVLVNYCSVFLVDDMATKREVMEAGSIKEKIKILLSVIGPKEISLGPFMPSLKF